MNNLAQQDPGYNATVYGNFCYFLPVPREEWHTLEPGQILIMSAILDDEPTGEFPCVVAENKMSAPENKGLMIRFRNPHVKNADQEKPLLALASGINKLYKGVIGGSAN